MAKGPATTSNEEGGPAEEVEEEAVMSGSDEVSATARRAHRPSRPPGRGAVAQPKRGSWPRPRFFFCAAKPLFSRLLPWRQAPRGGWCTRATKRRRGITRLCQNPREPAKSKKKKIGSLRPAFEPARDKFSAGENLCFRGVRFRNSLQIFGTTV